MSQPTTNDGARAGLPIPQAQALVMRRNFLIAVIHDNRNAEMVLAAQQGVLEALRDTDYALVVRPVERAMPGMEQDLRRFLETHLPTGVVLLPGAAELEAVVQACHESGCRLVRMAATDLGEPRQQITTDDRKAAAHAATYLIGLGHERIGFVSGPDEPGPAQQRELGYLDAMADHDLDRGPALIATGDFSFESGIAAGNLLLEVSPRPTAILAANDGMAAGVIHSANARGIAVPGQLSVVGFEDAPIAAQIWPPLTTVHVPVAMMACAAVFKMIYPEQADTLPGHFELELITRGSAARAAE
jgi:LacI family transcriptional regulator